MRDLRLIKSKHINGVTCHARPNTIQLFNRKLCEAAFDLVVFTFLQLLVGPVGQAESVALSVGKGQGGRRLGWVIVCFGKRATLILV